MDPKKPASVECMPGGVRISWNKDTTDEELEEAIAAFFPEEREPFMKCFENNCLAMGSANTVIEEDTNNEDQS